MFKRITVTVVAACLALAALAVPASAQDAVPFTKKLQISGQTASGSKLKNATFTVERFVRKGGKAYAEGDLAGRFRGRNVRREDVRVPVKSFGPATGAQASQLPNIPGACEILNLQLGPITLNLLGLVVRTNAINVRIDAVPGQGNLLGNLLCAITRIISPPGGGSGLTGAVNDLVAVLNSILALVPRQ